MTGFTFRERLVLPTQAPLHTRARTASTKNNVVALLFEQPPPARISLFFPLSSVVLLLLASRSRRGDIFDDGRREQDKKSSDFKGEVRRRLRDALHERRGEIARGENRAGKVRSLFFLFAARIFLFVFGVCVFVVVVVLSFFLSLSCAA